MSAERDGSEWVFTVLDNGIGIEPRHYEKICDIFQRLYDQSRYPGTGIGLAICRRVVQRHGGGIGLQSEPGEGSAARLAIPGMTEEA